MQQEGSGIGMAALGLALAPQILDKISQIVQVKG